MMSVTISHRAPRPNHGGSSFRFGLAALLYTPARGFYLFAMRALARLLQFAGLTIPPLAMVAQLSQQITAGRMLQFLVFSVCLFLAGYLLQNYRRP
jgi:hypothetical protein